MGTWDWFLANRSKREIQRERALLGREKREIQRQMRERTGVAKQRCAVRRRQLEEERDRLREEVARLTRSMRGACREDIDESTADLRQRLEQVHGEIQALHLEEAGVQVPLRRRRAAQRAAATRWDKRSEWMDDYLREAPEHLREIAAEFARSYQRQGHDPIHASVLFAEWVEANPEEVDARLAEIADRETGALVATFDEYERSRGPSDEDEERAAIVAEAEWEEIDDVEPWRQPPALPPPMLPTEDVERVREVALVVVRDGRNKVLVVRPKESAQWRLPGREVLGREEPFEAALEGLREQTGLAAYGKDMLELYEDEMEGWHAHVYVVDRVIEGLSPVGPGVQARWGTWADLTGPRGAFPELFRVVKAALGKNKPKPAKRSSSDYSPNREPIRGWRLR